MAGLICGSAAIYLIGNALFTRAVGGEILISHWAAVAALGLLFAAHPLLEPLAVSWLGNLVLLIVVIADDLGYRRRRRHTANTHPTASGRSPRSD